MSSSGPRNGSTTDALRLKTAAALRGRVKPGARLLVALSGGPDSTALLLLLHDLKDELRLSIGAIHVNHGLRGAESAGDARFCAALCARFGVPFAERRVHVERYRAAAGGSVQSAARELRYMVFRRLVSAGSADAVATAHTADDAAETFLLNLVRGAGPRGLSGIPPVRDNIVLRPLLGASKAELLACLAEKGEEFRTDSSNLSEKYLRNKIRLSLIPLLEAEYNPAVRPALGRAADIMAEVDDFMGISAARELEKIARRSGDGGMEFETARFAALHPALQRALVRRALETVRKSLAGLSFRNLEAVRGVAVAEGESRVAVFKGICARSAHGVFYLEKRAFSVPPFSLPFAEDGRMEMPELDRAITAEETSLPPEAFDPSCKTVYIDAERLPPDATLRNRRDGDTFHPLGAPGGRKLKKFLIDAKVPRWERDALPLLASGNEVLWVAGLRLSEKLKITPATKRALKLSLVGE